MQPARFLFGRFAGDRNLVHRSAPNRIPPCFYPSPILVPGTTRSFFLQNFFHSGRVFRLTEIPSYYLEGVTICVATEKKGRKKNSSLPVFPPFSMIEISSMMKFALKPIRMLFAAGRRVKKRFVSSAYPRLPFPFLYRRFLRFVTGTFIFVIAPKSFSPLNRFSSFSS